MEYQKNSEPFDGKNTVETEPDVPNNQMSTSNMNYQNIDTVEKEGAQNVLDSDGPSEPCNNKWRVTAIVLLVVTIISLGVCIAIAVIWSQGTDTLPTPSSPQATVMSDSHSMLERERAIRAEEEQKRVEREMDIRAEEEKRRVELEKSIRAEEEQKILEKEAQVRAEEELRRMESETQIRMEEEKKRIEEEAAIREEEAKKRSDLEREIRAEEEKKRIEGERAIRAEEESKRIEGERAIRAEEEAKRLQAVKESAEAHMVNVHSCLAEFKRWIHKRFLFLKADEIELLLSADSHIVNLHSCLAEFKNWIHRKFLLVKDDETQLLMVREEEEEKRELLERALMERERRLDELRSQCNAGEVATSSTMAFGFLTTVLLFTQILHW